MGLRAPTKPLKTPADDKIQADINKLMMHEQAMAFQEPEQVDATPPPMQPLMTPEESLESAYQVGIDQQRKNIDAMNAQQDMILGQDTQTNISPVLGLIDQWTGSNLVKSYVPPESPMEKQLLIAKLQDRISEAQQGLSKEQREFLKNKLELSKPKPVKYHYMQNESGEIVGINPADPTDVVGTGSKGYRKPDEPKIPQAVPGYVVKGTDQPVFRTGTGFVDGMGNPVEAEMKPEKSIQAQQKSQNEAVYRRNIMDKNARELESIVDKVGTMEVTGPEGARMDKLLYDLAIDYAKLVDPDSVAREGEVAAAQKYALPIRNSLAPGMPKGSAYTNETAKSLIRSYIKDLDERLKAKSASTGLALPPADGLTPEEQAELDALEQGAQ